MNKPTLAILAAGMGSRYGGMKQIDGVGNHEEPIIEFSIFDAYEAGFKKVVLIIKKEHEDLFRKALTDRVSKYMEVEFAYQEMDDLPNGITVPEGRVKPWGTTHALLALRNVVNEPFAIINADDFYGKDAYRVLYQYLANEITDDHYAMVGYACKNTLSDSGTVTRGLCKEENGYLTKIQEIQKIAKKDEKAVYEENGETITIPDDALVSMNFWGFTPKIFSECESILENYLKDAITENPLKCEHVIPTAIGDLVSENKCKVKMLSSKDQWFGVTYQEDKPMVMNKIQEMKDANIYPDILWK